MARPKEFDRTDAVEKALTVFWQHGYEGTSLNALMAAMGLSKSSLYDTFESKRQLYLEAIDHYTAHHSASQIAKLIASHDNPLAGIRAVFDAMIDGLFAGDVTRGCFIGACASVLPAGDRQLEGLLGEGIAEIERAFEEALRTAAARGKIAGGRDPRDGARFLATTLQGIAVVGKAKRDPDALRKVASLALAALD